MLGGEITDNIYITLNATEHCKLKSCLIYVKHYFPWTTLLSLDTEEAFNTLENFFFKKSNFLRAIYSIYVELHAKLKDNNIYSHRLIFRRRICQRCSLFPLLFALVMEPLATANNVNIDI